MACYKYCRREYGEPHERPHVRGCCFEEDSSVSAHQHVDGIEAQERERFYGTFGVADGRYEEPDGDDEAVDLGEVPEENSERGEEPADTCCEEGLRDQQQGQVEQGRPVWPWDRAGTE